MNLRQKAKRYKKLAEKYKADSEMLKTLLLAESFKKRATDRRIRPLQVMQIIPYYNDMRIDAERAVKERLAQKFVDFILENDLVYFEFSDAKEWGETAKIAKAHLTVLEPKEITLCKDMIERYEQATKERGADTWENQT